MELEFTPATNPTWPTEDDLAILRRRWKEGVYAGNTVCKCGKFAYCYGKTYEKKQCLDCYVADHKPKRKYTKRAKKS